MTRIAKGAGIVTALAAGFFLLPSDRSTDVYRLTCQRSPERLAQLKARESANAERPTIPPKRVDGGWEYDLSSGPYTAKAVDQQFEVNVTKSGLRRAIEGRLAWLGLESGYLEFLNRKCAVEDDQF